MKLNEKSQKISRGKIRNLNTGDEKFLRFEKH